MTYQEAINKSLTVKWEISTCGQGEQCWCRAIKPVEPIVFEDGDSTQEFYVVGPGELQSEIANHLVIVHNDYIERSVGYNYCRDK